MYSSLLWSITLNSLVRNMYTKTKHYCLGIQTWSQPLGVGSGWGWLGGDPNTSDDVFVDDGW